VRRKTRRASEGVLGTANATDAPGGAHGQLPHLRATEVVADVDEPLLAERRGDGEPASRTTPAPSGTRS
jgi:hypothetical protein